ncbi:MAG TPA: G8 domain-containing protein, partial [Lacibacter sp.]|nr:G8 domain-containing protein [Lacibacter sp.]
MQSAGFHTILKRLAAVCLLVISTVSASAQTIFDWRNDAPDANFRQGDAGARWFDNTLLISLQDEPPGPGNILRFNNINFPDLTNNVPGTYNLYQLIFGAGSSMPRSISGNPLRFFNYLGVNPRIENQSTAVTHTISTPLEGDGDPAYALEINPQAGNLIINSTINNQGSPVHVLGGAGRTLELNGLISGSGGFELQQNSFVILLGLNTYTGPTTLRAGVVRILSNVHVSLAGPFGNNAGNLFLAGGSIQNNTATFDRPITISGNGSNLDAYAANRTVAAPISAAAGNWNFSVGANTFPSANGQVLTLSGAITNGAGTLSLTKTGSSTCILSGTNSFTGGLTINGGILTIQTAAALPPGTAVTLSGGTLQVGSVAASSTLNAGTLQMTTGSTIDLGTATNAFDLIFSGSGPSFTGTLTINNWSAVNGKRIRITNTAHINTVLAQIQFTGYAPGAVIRNGDELWPAGLFFTAATGNFGDPATWVGGVVPTSGASIVVNAGHTVTVDGNYTLRSMDIQGTLTCNAAHTITTGNSFAKISNHGSFQFTDGTVVWNSAGGYTDGTVTPQFFNLTLNGTLSTVRNPQVNGTLLFNSGGVIATGTILYGPNSTLQYNKNSSWLMAREWNFWTTPANIVVGGNTNINFSTSAAELGNMACSGNLTIESGSALNLELKRGSITVGGDIVIHGTLVFPLAVYSGTLDLTLSGNWLRTSGAPPVIFNNRAVRLVGNRNITITGPTAEVEQFRVIRLNKDAGRIVTLNSPVNVSAEMHFGSGYIISTATNFFSISHFSAVNTAASVNSFVNGPVRKEGQTFPSTASFIFPVGKIVGTEYHYRPLTISAPGSASDTYTAEFHRANPQTVNGSSPISPSASGDGLATVSACEYWDLSQSPGSRNVDVTLSWSNHPSGRSRCNVGAYVNNLSELVVVPYYNGMWGDQFPPYFGRSSTSGTPNPTTSPFRSTITWTNTQPSPPNDPNIDSYIRFTLGSTDWRFNPLPYNLLSLEAKLQGGDALLDWKVQGNQLIQRYQVEHSTDGSRFRVLETLPAEVDISTVAYSFRHAGLPAGANFYRVVAVDQQGQPFISPARRIWVGAGGRPEVYPN